MKVYNSITELVGNTPIVRLGKADIDTNSSVFVKLEYFNPSKSVKDRAALSMINAAEKSGGLVEGSLIIEATSGNTGIALATIAAAKHYQLKLVIPDTMSVDKINYIKALGAEVILTEGVFGMKKAFRKADELKKEYPNAFVPSQITNLANPGSHEETTAVEIWDDMDGMVDYFVAGSGTGGTICGTGKKLKKLNPDIKVICVEPAGSPVLSGGKRGPHKIQGIGPGFIPQTTRPEIFDDIVKVSDDDAMDTARYLARKEGIFVGISSGAAVFAAINLSKKVINKNIVVIAPDTGERYLNTEVYNENYKGNFVS